MYTLLGKCRNDSWGRYTAGCGYTILEVGTHCFTSYLYSTILPLFQLLTTDRKSNLTSVSLGTVHCLDSCIPVQLLHVITCKILPNIMQNTWTCTDHVFHKCTTGITPYDRFWSYRILGGIWDLGIGCFSTSRTNQNSLPESSLLGVGLVTSASIPVRQPSHHCLYGTKEIPLEVCRSYNTQQIEVGGAKLRVFIFL